MPRSGNTSLTNGVLLGMPVTNQSQTALGEILAERTAEGAAELYDKLENRAVRC